MRKIFIRIPVFTLWVLACGALAPAQVGRGLDPAVQRHLTEAAVFIESNYLMSNRDWDSLPVKVQELWEKYYGSKRRLSAYGSGFIVDRSGLIVTNAHVVDNFSEPFGVSATQIVEMHFLRSGLKVTVHPDREDEKTYRANIVKVDRDSDLAILRIPGSGEFRPLDFYEGAMLKPGAVVHLAGFPQGKTPDYALFWRGYSDFELEKKKPAVSINTGTITSLRRYRGEGRYQLDINANPGNSGGPVVDRDGRVIGVINSMLTGAQSINFAIPVRYVERIMPNREDKASEAGGDGATTGEAPPAGDGFDSFASSGTFKMKTK